MSSDKKFDDAVLDYLLAAGESGESVSYLQRSMREDGWRGLGSCLVDFEDMLREHGFTVTPNQRNERGQKFTAVTL